MKKYWKVSLLAALVAVAAVFSFTMKEDPLLADPAIPDDMDLLTSEEQVPLDAVPGTEVNPYEGLDDTQIAYVEEVLALVNQARAEAGVGPLILDNALRQAAQVRAEECVKVFSHTRPNGTSYKTAIAEAGITATYVGENVATGYPTAQRVVTGWLNSEGHRKNILNGNYTKIGIGVEKNTGNRYGGYSWAQLFMK